MRGLGNIYLRNCKFSGIFFVAEQVRSGGSLPPTRHLQLANGEHRDKLNKFMRTIRSYESVFGD